jgi:hypothetical protein
MENSIQPTLIQFKAFENAYDYFNERLFQNDLPPVILNLSRKSKAMGFVAPFRWRRAEDAVGKGSIHELSINPEILSMSLIDVYSTLVHEQVHIWQYTHGNPSRNGYHNKEWADKMLSVGLIPSDTGKEGGNTTGQNMGDYPEAGGIFLSVLAQMPEAYKLPFVSVEGDHRLRFQAPTSNAETETEEGEEEQAAAAKPKSKNKYTCFCGCNVWGKVGLNLICGDCGEKFSMEV